MFLKHTTTKLIAVSWILRWQIDLTLNLTLIVIHAQILMSYLLKKSNERTQCFHLGVFERSIIVYDRETWVKRAWQTLKHSLEFTFEALTSMACGSPCWNDLSLFITDAQVNRLRKRMGHGCAALKKRFFVQDRSSETFEAREGGRI